MYTTPETRLTTFERSGGDEQQHGPISGPSSERGQGDEEHDRRGPPPVRPARAARCAEAGCPAVVVEHHDLAEERPADEQETPTRIPTPVRLRRVITTTAPSSARSSGRQRRQHAPVGGERRDLAALVELAHRDRRRRLDDVQAEDREEQAEREGEAGDERVRLARAVDERLEPSDPEEEVLEARDQHAERQEEQADPEEQRAAGCQYRRSGAVTSEPHGRRRADPERRGLVPARARAEPEQDDEQDGERDQHRPSGWRRASSARSTPPRPRRRRSPVASVPSESPAGIAKAESRHARSPR